MNEAMPIEQDVAAQPMVVNEITPEEPETTDSSSKPKIKATFFLIYLFQFIFLGIKSIKYGLNAYNPNSIIDTGVETEEQKKAQSKIQERIELKKNSIRGNPKYVEMKQNLANQLTAEAGQKYDTPVVFEFTAMDQEGKLKKGKFNGVSKLL